MFALEVVPGEKSVTARSYFCLCARGEGPYVVGRNATSHIHVDSQDVSRQHASLEVITFRDYLREVPAAHAAYESYRERHVAERRRRLDERAAQGLATEEDEEQQAAADADDDEAHEELLMSLVLRVRNHSKFGVTLRVSDDNYASSPTLRRDGQGEASFRANSSFSSPHVVEGATQIIGAEVYRVASVAYLPSVTTSLYALSFSPTVHFRVTYRPIIATLSHFHYTDDHVREMTEMYRQLGCTVLSETGPLPIVTVSGIHEYLVHAHGVLQSTPSSPAQSSPAVERRRLEEALDARIELRPLARFHVCDEIDDSAAVLQALAIGYTIVLPVFLFELFAQIAADPGRPIRDLPHPSGGVGGATAEPQRKRDVFGSAVYCHPDSPSCPFSLYPIPQSSTTARSRIGLLANRSIYFPNPLLARRNGAVVAMCGAARTVVGLEPPVSSELAGGLQIEQSLPRRGRRSVGGAVSSAATTPSQSPERASPPPPLTAGLYTIVSREMEDIITNLFSLAQLHFAAYQRYPMAVLLTHADLLAEVMPTPTAEAELRAIVMSVHRGWSPVTERSLHTALLTNKFLPAVVEEFVLAAVEEERAAGLHIRGLDAVDDAGAREQEADQRRRMLNAVFGELLAKDPATVDTLLQTHNDALFQQLSSDKAGRYAAAEAAVLSAGPENLGGGLLAVRRAPGKGAGAGGAANLTPDRHVLRRSLPVGQQGQAAAGAQQQQPGAAADEGADTRAGNEADAPANATGGADGDDGGVDSDATPSSVDSDDFPLNHHHKKASYTKAFKVYSESDAFRAAIAAARDVSTRLLEPQVPKVQQLHAHVLQTALALRKVHTMKTVGSARAEAATTLRPHSVAYCTQLLTAHVLPQLEHLEGSALDPQERPHHPEFRALWDVADGLRVMLEDCIRNHKREVGEKASFGPAADTSAYFRDPQPSSPSPSSSGVRRATTPQKKPSCGAGGGGDVRSAASTSLVVQPAKSGAARRCGGEPGAAAVEAASPSSANERSFGSAAPPADDSNDALAFRGARRIAQNSPSRARQGGPAPTERTKVIRYAPMPLFAAQKLHRNQVDLTTTARAASESDPDRIDTDPTKAHLTREERVAATLHEPVNAFDTKGIVRRRDLYASRYGADEGNKRFVLWLNSQSPLWTREFHRTLDRKHMSMAELFNEVTATRSRAATGH